MHGIDNEASANPLLSTEWRIDGESIYSRSFARSIPTLRDALYVCVCVWWKITQYRH